MTTTSIQSPSVSGEKKSQKRALTIATAIMMGSVLLSRITGLVREQVLAAFGGTSFEMDAYVTAFLIPELLNHFLAGGFLSITFIPIFQKHCSQGNRLQAWRSFSNLICIGSAVFALLIPLAMIFTPEILGLSGKHITDSSHLSLTVRLTRIIIPAQLFFYWGAFFSAVQMAEHRFFLPAMAPLCYNLGIIFGGLILGPSLGIEGFAWGVLIGAFAGNVVLQLPGAIKSGMRFRPVFKLSDPDLVKYVKLTLPLILGLGMTFSNEIFFRYFGSFLSEGATSSINYALRTTMMIVAVFGQASGMAFYPFITKMAADGQYGKMTEMLNSVLTKIAVYLIPLSILMLLLSEQIISILFEHGEFGHQSTILTASVFSVYLIGSFAFSASMIISRSFYATQNTVLPLIITSSISLLSIPLYIIFSKSLGPKGIALAAILGMTLQFLLLYYMWYRKYGQLSSTVKLAVSIVKIILICCAVAFPGYLLMDKIPVIFTSKMIQNLFTCTVISVPSIFLIFALYEVCGIQHFADSIKGFLRKSK
jgi:putative peptidoglycan lipid II flippase